MEIRKQKDEHIRNALSQEATQIEPGKNLFNKIRQSIYEKEANMTTKKRVQGIKKSNKLVAVAALCMLLGAITIFGATMGRSWISHGRITYTSFPSKEKIQKDVGFVPKYIDTLPGGFKYNSGGNGESQLEDENGSTLTKTKYIMLSYMRNNEKRPLSFHASQIEENFIDNTHNQIVGNYKGVALYYHEKDYKFVPVNYELTEEDKRAYESGEIEISVGAPQVSNENIQSISWYENGLQYMLLGNDYNFEIEEMIDMAKAIMGQG